MCVLSLSFFQFLFQYFSLAVFPAGRTSSIWLLIFLFLLFGVLHGSTGNLSCHCCCCVRVRMHFTITLPPLTTTWKDSSGFGSFMRRLYPAFVAPVLPTLRDLNFIST